MKYIVIILILLSGCQSLIENNTIVDFIPGSYIFNSETEFGRFYDTLIISPQNVNASQYKIEKRFRYDRMMDGKPDPEYKIEETTGIYDDKTKLMQDQNTGNYYTFDPEKKLLFVGTNQYKKLE